MNSLIRGTVIAGAAALVIVLTTLLGLSSPWPVLLVAGIALARPQRPGVLVGVVVGAIAWWFAMALRAGVLPDSTGSEVIATVAAVAVVTVVAAATRDRVPLFAGLAGAALFAALYEPVFADSPTHFLTDSPLAFGSVVVALGLGALAAVVADVLTGLRGRRDTTIALQGTEGTA